MLERGVYLAPSAFEAGFIRARMATLRSRDHRRRSRRLRNLVTQPAPSLVLLDLDGVLVASDHRRRMEHLGAAIGRDPDRVYAALFEAGLEARYDAGEIDSAQYLAELGQALDHPVDPEAWRAARAASMDCAPETCERIAALTQRCDIAILQTTARSSSTRCRRHSHRFSSRRIFCSGALRMAKPSIAVFLTSSIIRPRHTRHAFLDDNHDNVEARAKPAACRTRRTPRSIRRHPRPLRPRLTLTTRR